VAAGRLQRIADALQVPVTFFYRDEPAQERRETGFGYLKSKKSLRMARAFADIRAAPARHALTVIAEQIRRNERGR
jgi:hypothetical protein